MSYNARMLVASGEGDATGEFVFDWNEVKLVEFGFMSGAANVAVAARVRGSQAAPPS